MSEPRTLAVRALSLLVLLPALALAGDVPVLVYRDANASSQSDLAQKVAGQDAPLPDLPVRLLGGDDRAAATGADGVALFEGVPDGSWLIVPELPDGAAVTSRNVAVRLPQLLDAGATELVYLALGDSTPVVGSKDPYPKRLAGLLDGLVPVTLVNQADPGTTTENWLPGVGGNWASPTVQGWLPKADLITLTIGGNDLQDAAFSGDVDMALELIDQALENIAAIAAGIREVNPAADLVVTVYPNYSLASEWEQYIPASLIGLVRMALDSKLQEMRAKIGAIEGVVVADCYAAFQVGPMDDFMYDPIHVNDAGHQLYAETIFHALGGVELPADDGLQRMVGLALPEGGGEDAGAHADAGGSAGGDAGADAGVAADAGGGDVEAPEDAAGEGADMVGEGADAAPGGDSAAGGGAGDAGAGGDALLPPGDVASAAAGGASADGCAAAPGAGGGLLGALLLLALVRRRLA